MQEGRSADEDGLHVVAGEQVLVVGVMGGGSEVVGETGGGFGRGVGGGDDAGGADIGQSGGVMAGNAAAAYEADIEHGEFLLRLRVRSPFERTGG